MAEQTRRIIVDGVNFSRLFHFPKLFRAIPLALQPPKLVVALFMVLLLVAFGSIWDAVTTPRVHPHYGLLAGAHFADEQAIGTFKATATHIIGNVEFMARGLLALDLPVVGSAIANIVLWMPIALWGDHKLFMIVFGLISFIIATVGGGAISRMAALEAAGHERLRARDALRFSMTHWPRFVVAPLLPLVAVIIVAFLIALLGLLTWVPVLDVIAGLLYIIALLLGFVIAFLLLGYIAAAPMIVPAIACENCDAADAQQRAYAYVLSRPLHLLGYVIMAAIALALGFLLVSLFAGAILNITGGLFSAWTRSPAAETAGGYAMFELFAQRQAAEVEGFFNTFTAWLIGLWETLVLGLVAAFVLSFFFVASTILYLLMRRVSDGQAIEDIWRPGLVPGSLARMPESASETPSA